MAIGGYIEKFKQVDKSHIVHTMVYITDDETEEVTDSYMEGKNGVKLAVVECDDGYFVYKIPVVESPDYSDIEGEVLDCATSDFKIIEDSSGSNQTVFNGLSDISVPQVVIDEAERISGATLLD